jgi:predicted MPP superfamily phosphohydrolase
LKIEVLLITDAHRSEESEEKEEKWFPEKIRKMPREKIKAYLNYWDALTRRAFQKLLREAKKQGSFDLIISLGDDTPGTNQMGLITEKAQREQQRYKELIANAFPETPKLFLWSDHGTGYGDPITKLQGWEKGRMSIESFEAAEKFIGPKWFSRTIGGFMLLVPNSEIIRESKNPHNPEQAFFIEKAKEQERFIRERLENTDNKVILLIHDPMQIRHLQKILEPHRGKIVLILAGHLHSPTIWKIYCFLSKTIKAIRSFNISIPTILKRTSRQQAIGSIAQEMAEMQKTIQSFNIKIIPAPWGGMAFPQQIVLGRGGFATMELNDGQVILKYHKL